MPKPQALVDESARRGGRAIAITPGVLAAISPVTPALRRRRHRAPATDAAPRTCFAAGHPALVLVLSGVQDAGNVGAIVRAAEGGGATGIICTEGTADPFGWKALRGGMGSTLRLPIAVAPADRRDPRERRGRWGSRSWLPFLAMARR